MAMRQVPIASQKGRTARRDPARRIARSLAAAAIVGTIVAVSARMPHLNDTTVALLLVLVVVGIALRWGRLEAAVGAFCASLALDYFLLPPFGFGIESADHWLATFVFLTVAFGTALAKSRALKKTMEAEIAHRSVELKSAIFDALAHEARGRLGTIHITATTLLSDRSGVTEVQREMLGIIVAEVVRISTWIEQTARITRAETNRLSLDRAPRDVKELVSGAVEALDLRLADRRISVSIPESLPAAVCDGEIIQSVLRLLLDNAVKYTPAGSPIAISATRDASMIVVSVSDKGPGIPEHDLARIFEKHYRGVHQEAGPSGSGMGLADAKSMVECQGGGIWVTNRREGGAAFHLSLPAAI